MGKEEIFDTDLHRLTLFLMAGKRLKSRKSYSYEEIGCFSWVFGVFVVFFVDLL